LGLGGIGRLYRHLGVSSRIWWISSEGVSRASSHDGMVVMDDWKTLVQDLCGQFLLEFDIVDNTICSMHLICACFYQSGEKNSS